MWAVYKAINYLTFIFLVLAGYHRTKWIEEKIYFYNRGRIVTSGWCASGAKVALYIRSKKPYNILEC